MKSRGSLRDFYLGGMDGDGIAMPGEGRGRENDPSG